MAELANSKSSGQFGGEQSVLVRFQTNFEGNKVDMMFPI